MKELPAPPQLHELMGKHIAEQKRPPLTLTQHTSGFPAFLPGFAIGAFLMGYGLYTLISLEKAKTQLLQEQLQEISIKQSRNILPTSKPDILETIQQELQELTVQTDRPQS